MYSAVSNIDNIFGNCLTEEATYYAMALVGIKPQNWILGLITSLLD
jgi:hypothetical protein